ncbi:pyrazinamidase/nicotinamidase [Spiroplasma syrphidicola EA-1]|uniref:nicotinamidase n=1 Tax=Spiroplasma syrphidicola EA-1 TaxID=1276229 RepID=R4UKH5_9MOLU|nr:isochorismatase family protein [Spiroplasma syrphidicola]AGM25771.1 pyrazinamidase/nicotinamidase [Spiroplasma syrphidicola EA-1]
MKKALIVVDYQHDFVNPTGSLYVRDAEKLLPKIKALIAQYHQENNLVIATKDYHPENHCSFTIWPPHCRQNTPGAELYHLPETTFAKIITKGTRQNSDSYSAFFDDDQTSNGLHEFLQANEVTMISIIGVALDVCVSATLKDAIKLNYQGEVLLDYCVGLENKITF